MRPACATARRLGGAPAARTKTVVLVLHRHVRPASTTTAAFDAAPPLDLGDGDSTSTSTSTSSNGGALQRLRVVPASAAYFSAKPTFTDDCIALGRLLRSVERLPTVPAAAAPRMAWKTVHQYRVVVNEPVPALRYHGLVRMLARLHRIDPALRPPAVAAALRRYQRAAPEAAQAAQPALVDAAGRAKGVGRRKSASAVAWLVEGEGEACVNGLPVARAFARLGDRERALWPLRATHRLGCYNLWARAQGGGTAAQAGALTLAVARALLVHEPALKPALRRAGCVTRDVRRVERKKHGRVKARKKPAWVKR